MNKISTVEVTPNVQIRVQILNTIARSIYSDSRVKIREAVANSMDNEATWFILYADRPSRTISLMDNGIGITRGRFDLILQNIGYGMGKKERYSNSYFGLGLMSILELGKKAMIITRSKEEGEIIRVEVPSEEIFSEQMEGEPISAIGDLIKFYRNNDLPDRERVSILSGEEITKSFGDFPAHFTEIILEDIEENEFNKIISQEYEIDLRKILPLKVQENEPFFKSIKDPVALQWILDKLSDREYCPTIDVYTGISDAAKELAQIWKYYPDFRSDLEIGKTDIGYEVREQGDKKFALYYLYSIDDLQVQERAKENRETGLWIRNKNFLVKEADYLDSPSSRKDRILHEPLRNWLFGEIFHQGMTDFLVVTRNEYNWESPDFQKFLKEIREILEWLNKALRDTWKYSGEVRDLIIEPFIEIERGNNPFSRCDKTLSEMGILDSKEKAKEILERFEEKRKPELESEDKRIDILLEKKKEEIILADDEKVKVIIDPKIAPGTKYSRQREAQSNRIIIRISPSIFSPNDVIFLGEPFKVYYVAGEEELPGISVDRGNHKIFVNPFNQEVSKYTVSFVEICIATEIAYIYSRTKDEMRSFILRLLGAKLAKEYETPRKYLISLKDELQRRQWSK